jgi:hypothetical protein
MVSTTTSMCLFIYDILLRQISFVTSVCIISIHAFHAQFYYRLMEFIRTVPFKGHDTTLFSTTQLWIIHVSWLCRGKVLCRESTTQTFRASKLAFRKSLCNDEGDWLTRTACVFYG